MPSIKSLPSLPLLLLLLASTPPAPPSAAAPSTETFIYGGCSQAKYTPGSTYESNVNSLLTSLLNSASFTLYTNLTVAGAVPGDTVYGLIQCRGDLPSPGCGKCAARAVAQLGSLCLDACGGALQLEGCFVKYDNVSFLGVEDKTVVVKKCGPSMGYDSGMWARRDAVLAYLAAPDGGGSGGGYAPFRVGGSGDVQGVAQCVGDLSAGECQDCVAEAVGRLRADCGAAGWGDVFLGKCYARFSHAGFRAHGGGSDVRNEDEEIEKTLAVIIGLIAGIAFFVVFVAFLSHCYEKQKGGK